MFPSIQATKKVHCTLTGNNIIEYKDREMQTDALSEMLKTEEQYLIHLAVQSKLE